MSINSSRVPNADYEVEAVNSLQTAYELHPDDLEKRMKAFSEAFTEKFNAKDGWKVGQSCQKIFEYKTKQDESYFVNINVNSGKNSFIVKIFE